MEQYRIDPKKGMEIGLYSVGEHFENPYTGHQIRAQQRIRELIEASKLAEPSGLTAWQSKRLRFIRRRYKRQR